MKVFGGGRCFRQYRKSLLSIQCTSKLTTFLDIEHTYWHTVYNMFIVLIKQCIDSIVLNKFSLYTQLRRRQNLTSSQKTWRWARDQSDTERRPVLVTSPCTGSHYVLKFIYRNCLPNSSHLFLVSSVLFPMARFLTKLCPLCFHHNLYNLCRKLSYREKKRLYLIPSEQFVYVYAYLTMTWHNNICVIIAGCLAMCKVSLFTMLHCKLSF